jgi:hypothetical protein
MTQIGIKFFWPLTEQIPLDLDYSVCEKPKLTVSSSAFTGIAIRNDGPEWTTSLISNTVNTDSVETNELVLKLDKQPNFVVRWLYKLLKINWKTK